MRRKAFVALQVAFAAAVLWFAAGKIVEQWNAARQAGLGFHARWWLIALSGLVVLVAYALLIEVWRSLLRSWGFQLAWRDAARIWFVSNLGRYIPGKVWQIGAMAVMAERAGVSKVAATTSSVVVNLVNLLAGVGIVVVTGASLLANRVLLIGAAVALTVGLFAIPAVLPRLARLAEWLSGKPVQVPPLPQAPVWGAAAGCLVAWCLYGVAFFLLARGVTTDSTGPVTSYVSAFTASYILGYVSLFVPGGIGIRDGSLVALLDQLRLTTGGAAILITVASRLWLTVLEVIPGVLYLTVGARRKHAAPRS